MDEIIGVFSYYLELSIFFLFIASRRTLLNVKYENYFYTVTFILAVIGIIGSVISEPGYLRLLTPLLSYIILRGSNKLFVHIFKREWKESWYTMNLALLWDGIYTFVSLGLIFFIWVLGHYFLK